MFGTISRSVHGQPDSAVQQIQKAAQQQSATRHDGHIAHEKGLSFTNTAQQNTQRRYKRIRL